MKCKVSVIIPVYNAPEWVKLCVYAVFKNNTDDVLNKVIIMNDNSNEETRNLLKNLKKEGHKNGFKNICWWRTSI